MVGQGQPHSKTKDKGRTFIPSTMIQNCFGSRKTNSLLITIVSTYAYSNRGGYD